MLVWAESPTVLSSLLRGHTWFDGDTDDHSWGDDESTDDDSDGLIWGDDDWTDDDSDDLILGGDDIDDQI